MNWESAERGCESVTRSLNLIYNTREIRPVACLGLPATETKREKEFLFFVRSGTSPWKWKE